MRRLCLLLAFFVSPAMAGEESVRLKDGEGKDKVITQCGLCHSLDYIPLNANIMDKAGWEKTVNKMIKGMGAPIEDGDKKIIIDYLVSHYGR
ncbi:MAG: cytochrome c [Methylococcales bacterium]|nr:cytochrome c [Methylococcales bacterium]